MVRFPRRTIRSTVSGGVRGGSVLRRTAEDALLRRGVPGLIPHDTALRRLQELNEVAAPLVRLHSTELATDAYAQRDVTIWVKSDDQAPILDLYRKICPEVTPRSQVRVGALRVLSRCLHFPAYFLAGMEHYRSCYERAPVRTQRSSPIRCPSIPRSGGSRSTC